MQTNEYNYKIVVLGEGRVGKTSISLRYCKDKYDDNQEMTVNASYLEQNVKYEDKFIKLSLWDTAGQEKFNSLAPIYYRDANGAILVYDITFKESFAKVNKWIRELQQYAIKNIVIIIVGNKSDQEDNRQVNQQEVDEFCKKLNVKHFTCSAKNGQGIKQIFNDLIKEIYQVEKDDQNENVQFQKPKKIIHKCDC